MREFTRSGFGRLCIIQILAILMFIVSAAKISMEKEAFQNVTEFVAVEANYIGSTDHRIYRRGIRRTTGHDNKYQYHVNGQNYTATFYYELLRGSDRTIYYNPNNPSVYSKYQTLSKAKRANSGWIIFGLVLQGVVIFFAVRSVRKEQEKINVYENKGVVLSNDFDMSTNYGTMNDGDDVKETVDKVETIKFQTKTSTDKEESIPFQSKSNMNSEESIPFQSNTKTNEKGFDLYTEEEYKNLNK